MELILRDYVVLVELTLALQCNLGIVDTCLGSLDVGLGTLQSSLIWYLVDDEELVALLDYSTLGYAHLRYCAADLWYDVDILTTAYRRCKAALYLGVGECNLKRLV